jgi:endoglucanase
MTRLKHLLPAILFLFAAGSSFGQGSGYWHTSGNEILDSNNQAVRIAGINWYGFETTDEVVHGLWAQDYKSILNAIHANGYNTVRIPFSNQMVETPIVPSNISHNNGSGPINTDLQGLNSLQILDKIIAYAGQIGLRVILDNHRSEAGNSAESNGLWYTSSYPESAWITDWITLANRYKGNATVIGADLRNEPHNATSGGACWGCGSSTNDWSLAAERGGNAVLNANSSWLIFVEGTDCYNGDCGWWGGNLEGAQSHPVRLNVADRLVYSAHDYGPHEYGQSWFNSSTTYASLTAVWTKFWAYLSLNGIAPVWLGEFGTTNTASDISNTAPGSQGQWFSSLIEFLKSNSNIDWTYWALNGEDTYGLLDSNYDSAPASSQKQQALASIQFTLGGGTTPSCQAKPGTPAGLSAAAMSSSQIGLNWNSVSAPSGCSLTYDVYSSETAGFTPSSSNLLATGLSSPTYKASGLAAATTYYFVVTALDAAGQSGDSTMVSAKTQTSQTGVPSAPSSLAATATSSSAIQLTWHASASSGVTYNVYRSQTSGFLPSSSVRIATGVSGTSYTSSGLAASATYYFLVTAVDSNGESGPTNQASGTTLAASKGFSCHVIYTLNSQWNNGFNVSVAIQNTGSTAISSWTLTWMWSGNQSISQAWNANLVSAGPSVSLTNESWNGSIAAGATMSGMGFNATYSGANAAPSAFYVNGTACK